MVEPSERLLMGAHTESDIEWVVYLERVFRNVSLNVLVDSGMQAGDARDFAGLLVLMPRLTQPPEPD